MYTSIRTPKRALRLACALLAALPVVLAQPASNPLHPDWRKLGSSSVELELASPATGAVDAVWFSADGRTLYARTHSGRVFETADFENWSASTSPEPRSDNTGAPSVESLPAGAVARASAADPRHVYALGAQLYSSEDGGRTWTSLTSYKGESVIGPGQRDLAVSPLDPNQLVAANRNGVWRSMDGGLSWAGLNQFLPNLTIRKILRSPSNGHGVEAEIDGIGDAELPPGRSGATYAWQPVPAAASDRDAEVRRLYSAALGAEITATAAARDVVYAGSSDGRIWVSTDRARTWTLSRTGGNGPVEALFAGAQSPRIALAALGGAGAHVLRTTNTGAGGFWMDLTANLADVPAHSITADLSAGAVYVATARGVYYAQQDLETNGPPAEWRSITGNLPASGATAAELDRAGNQLYIALEGYGVYAALAPHRARTLQLVNAADFSSRPAAPGSLVSVLGMPVRSARAGNLEFPILAASATETQIQVPFEANGPSVGLALDSPSGRVSVGLAVQPASPAIFIDRDGAPMLVDADSGLMLDTSNTAHSNSRIQVLATGLGRVKPDWPTGLAAPLDHPPAVAATVRAFLDRVPVEVTRATLAPGYIGLYLIEIQLPALVNAGPAELYLAADGQESNRVRLYLEP